MTSPIQRVTPSGFINTTRTLQRVTPSGFINQVVASAPPHVQNGTRNLMNLIMAGH